ncbi:MAG: choice-of-anchor D domain-containing protein [Nitrospirae bacterium]|nr:MAG: choice-of-anchor D domain-containing protein [Nitrospirota bacterium]
MTMGIMVGGDLGGSAIGVAPGAKWVAAKIFNDAGESWDSIIHEAFQCILDPDGDPLTDDTPDVVNNSWGIDIPGVCFTEFQPDIDMLKTAGIAVVFSAGNSGPSGNTDLSPGNNTNGYAVGAVDPSMTIANFSSRGPSACDGSIFPEVVAPGVNIRSAYLTTGGLFSDSYAFGSGTSFAAPHVAGAMALLVDAFPGISPSELERVLEGTALDIGDVCPDNAYGYGLIDPLRAFDTLQNNEPRVSVIPCSHDFGIKGFGKTFSLKTITVSNLGAGPLSISDVSLVGQAPEDFQIQNDACSGQALSPGASCSFDLEYAPFTGGSSSALAVVQSDDPSNPSFEISLSGGAIELVSPNGGESIPSGTVRQIQWLAPPEAVDFNLRYSCDGGANWSVIGRNVTGTTYDWQVPVYGVDMNQCLVRVTAFDASGTKLGRDESDGFFTIEAVRITVTSPNGGESLQSGGTHPIQWITPPGGSEFTLRYSCDSGVTWSMIAKRVSGTSFDWSVPVFSENQHDCIIRVTAFNSLGVKLGRDESDNPFSIEVVRVVAPNGGEAITGGGQYTVTWVTNGTVSPVAKVVIRYSTDGGATWQTAGKVSGNPGSFLWNVPAITSTTVKVKVALKDATNTVIGRDRSDSDFEIK